MIPSIAFPLSVLKQAFAVLSERRQRLIVPVLMVVIIEAFQTYADVVYPMSDPFIWIVYGLPPEILLAPLMLLIFHTLLPSKGLELKWPESYGRKSLLFLGYHFLIKAVNWWVTIVIALAGAVVISLLSFDVDPEPQNYWVKALGFGVVMPVLFYFLIRFSMVYPIIADGGKSALQTSWNLTRSKVFPIALSSMPMVVIGMGIAEVPMDNLVGGELMTMSVVCSFISNLASLLQVALLCSWYAVLTREDDLLTATAQDC
jgi:hypothetical protein